MAIIGDLRDAVNSGDVALVQSLLDNGADPNGYHWGGRMTLLELAASLGSRDIVNALLNKGAEPYRKGVLGTSALTWAIKVGDLEIVRALIDKGANVNDGIINVDHPITGLGFAIKETPLEAAVKEGNAKIIALLLQAGARRSY